jgi:hypothetical protein
VLACEARAGEALRTLTGQEGLSLREAVAWCGGDEQLTVREATRLRRVEAAPGEPASEPASATTDEAVVGEPAHPVLDRVRTWCRRPLPVRVVARLDDAGLAALDAACRSQETIERWVAKVVVIDGSSCRWWTGALSGRGHGRK